MVLFRKKETLRKLTSGFNDKMVIFSSEKIQLATEELSLYIEKFFAIPLIGKKLAKMILDYNEKFYFSEEITLTDREIAQLAIYAMDLIDGQESTITLENNQAFFARDIEKIINGKNSHTNLFQAGIKAASLLKRGKMHTSSNGTFRNRFENLCHRNEIFSEPEKEEVLSCLWKTSVQKAEKTI